MRRAATLDGQPAALTYDGSVQSDSHVLSGASCEGGPEWTGPGVAADGKPHTVTLTDSGKKWTSTISFAMPSVAPAAGARPADTVTVAYQPATARLMSITVTFSPDGGQGPAFMAPHDYQAANGQLTFPFSFDGGVSPGPGALTIEVDTVDGIATDCSGPVACFGSYGRWETSFPYAAQ